MHLKPFIYVGTMSKIKSLIIFASKNIRKKHESSEKSELLPIAYGLQLAKS
jgi:hypothetical protein